MSFWTLGFALLAAIAYATLSHKLMVHAGANPWAIVAILGPLAVALGTLAWRRRNWLVLAALTLIGASLLRLASRGGVQTVNLLYVAQHVGIHLTLGVSFALSMRDARSLIGRIAERVQSLTPAMVIYTRHVTGAWVLYFFLMAMFSVVIYLSAGWTMWSLLANLGTPLAIALLFGGEYLLRYRLHPEFERVGLRQTLLAWHNSSSLSENRRR